MKANDRPLRDIFFPAAQLQVPLYQRPYVWDEERQWAPLWEDVHTLADRLLAEQGRGEVEGEPSAIERTPPHFLGAIVLDGGDQVYGEIDRRLVIDGQQRLTTLQVLLAAAHHAAKGADARKPAAQLLALLENGEQFTEHPDERWKVWPTNSDRAAFAAVMSSDGTVDPASSRFASAFAFFTKAIGAWLEDATETDASTRASALAGVLQHRIHLVVIELEKGDNAQVIFETLNDRGERLLAADLVKNYVFQNAKVAPAAIEGLYASSWKPFDVDRRWREEVRQGRLRRPRIDVFLQHWLALELGREVGSSDLFNAFKELHRKRAITTVELASEMAEVSKVFDVLDEESAQRPHEPEGTFVRRWRRVEASTLTPVVLSLFAPAVPVEARRRGLAALESYLVRRMLCQETTKAYNQLAVDLVAAIRCVAPEGAGSAVEALLLSQTADTRRWPTDAAVREALRDKRLYGWIRADRISMVLIAVENHLRAAVGAEHLVEPDAKYEVEHVLPQRWEAHWRFGDDISGSPEQRAERGRQLQRLGNLTLTSGRINKRLSNQPWLPSEADALDLRQRDPSEPRGKRDVLGRHSVLHLNKQIVDGHPDRWDEAAMAERRDALIDTILSIWPRPPAPEAT